MFYYNCNQSITSLTLLVGTTVLNNCKTLIHGGYFDLAVLAVKTKSPKFKTVLNSVKQYAITHILSMLVSS